MRNIGTKSINMSDIMVYLAMSSTTIDQILCFLGPHKIKMSHYFISLWYPLELGTFLISEATSESNTTLPWIVSIANCFKTKQTEDTFKQAQ